MHTLGAVARAVEGRLDGPEDLVLRGLAPVEEAGPADLVFAKDARNLQKVLGSKAGAVLCKEGDDVGGRPAVRVRNPRLAAARAVSLFRPPEPVRPGLHPTAVVGEGARLGEGCSLAAYAVVGAGARLGARVALGPHAVVGEGCRVGDDTRLDAHVVLYPGVAVGARCSLHAGVVVGAAGFGVEMGPEGPVAFPQHGTVVLGDDVRVGANTTIDRATFGATRVGDGTQIDNLVQISHNVTVGRGVIICALAGIAGGARFGDRSVMGPQGALSPEAVLGPGTVLGPRGALVSHERLDAPGQVYMGVPAVPLEDWKRWSAGKRRAARRHGGGRSPRSRKET